MRAQTNTFEPYRYPTNVSQKRAVPKKKKSSPAFFVIISILILCFTLGVCYEIVSKGEIQVEQCTNDTRVKCYKAIEIENGDTLSAIAMKYKDSDVSLNDYVNELASFNGIRADQLDNLKAGDYITIMYYDNTNEILASNMTFE